MSQTRNVGQCPMWWPPFCSTPQSLADAHYYVQCRAVMLWLLPRRETHWNLPGCPPTTGPISAVSGLKFTILWGHVEEILLLNMFFSDCCLSCEDIARQSCAMVPRWQFLATFLCRVFSASRAQHVSDLHFKFTLEPHHVSKYGRHPISNRWD